MKNKKPRGRPRKIKAITETVEKCNAKTKELSSEDKVFIDKFKNYSKLNQGATTISTLVRSHK
jgi:hypothetical protein